MTMMPVFFDGVWNNYAFPGPQSAPIPGVHNSRWLQSPTAKVTIDPGQWPRLEDYVSSVIERFGDDERVLLWDLYNEPGNEGLISNSPRRSPAARSTASSRCASRSVLAVFHGSSALR
jgi:hypothetical protein